MAEELADAFNLLYQDLLPFTNRTRHDCFNVVENSDSAISPRSNFLGLYYLTPPAQRERNGIAWFLPENDIKAKRAFARHFIFASHRTCLPKLLCCSGKGPKSCPAGDKKRGRSAEGIFTFH
ncbi:hypothetical protein AVEN_75752-1 [Araneus ventricosus]|uniref:Uncharacterized protein n=1 Tax=Araneus ventricosus TaxID=182803 RepID=A0A4Y2BNW6_ARAVE|nr:hypothetical protein AVEN_75752-1 [Araneus ventricosus]